MADCAKPALPLDAETFAALLEPLLEKQPSHLGLAVSGGPDSMALAFCAARWAKRSPLTPPPLAFIVDHRLRPESTQEATQVQQQLQRLGIEAHILTWQHDLVESRIHVKARDARYALLEQACLSHDIKTLLVAHQQEDQAETILMRLAKGSGIDGLAGIEPVARRGSLRIVRPLLTVSRAQIVATCEMAGIAYVTDPSNTKTKYARGRLRQVLPLLAQEGLTTERLTDLGNRAREAKEALDHATQALLRVATRTDNWGVVKLDLEQMRSAPKAIAARVLGSCLNAIHPQNYGAEREPLMALLSALLDDAPCPARTLHGCLVTKTEITATLMREATNITDTQNLSPGQSIVWDGRWQVTLSTACTESFTLRALGTQTHETVDRLAPNLRREVPQGRVRAGLPALWRGEILAVIPDFSGVQNAAKLCTVMLCNGLRG